ncbi:MAG: type II toxin-antitoxin system RelE/ParE family toxin [Spirochaetota bacterium]
MTLVYSAHAVDDLRHLRSFIAKRNPGSAERMGRELVERLESLPRFPRMGRPASRAPDPETIRDLLFGDYVVRYSLHETTIVVLRIWHHFEERTEQP